MTRGDGKAQVGSKRPKKQGYLSALEWKRRGVEVQELSGELSVAERHTVVSFTGREDYAEVDTAHRQWQRRLEALGCIPTTITTFSRSAIDIRNYEGVPRRFIRMPSAGRKGLHARSH